MEEIFMPIPESLADLSEIPENNSPQGGENIGGTLDNFLRAFSAIMKRDLSPKKHTHLINDITDVPKATLTDAGITQLTNDTDASVENKAATPKGVFNAIKDYSGFVKKAGDTMTGDLDASYLLSRSGYVGVKATADSYAGFEVIRDNNSKYRFESLPDNRWKFWNQNHSEIYIPARNGTVALEHEVVPRNGDTLINGRLFFENDHSYLNIKSKNAKNASFDFTVTNSPVAQCGIEAIDIGSYGVELRLFTTPPGTSFQNDRRRHTTTFNPEGQIWSLAYGWLHDFFAKQGDINNVLDQINNHLVRKADFVNTWYPQHYAGAEVYKIRPLGLMITLMNVNGGGNDFWLPEEFNGFAIVLGIDRGDGQITIGAGRMNSNNQIHIGGRSDTARSILVIGHKNF